MSAAYSGQVDHVYASSIFYGIHFVLQDPSDKLANECKYYVMKIKILYTSL